MVQGGRYEKKRVLSKKDWEKWGCFKTANAFREGPEVAAGLREMNYLLKRKYDFSLVCGACQARAG